MSEGEVILSYLGRGDRAVVAPAIDGMVLVGLYSADGQRVPVRMTPDEWDAFKAAGDRALGRAAKVRRPVAREDSDTIRARVAAACDHRVEDVALQFDSTGCGAIAVMGELWCADEIHALARAGIHAGPDGWEIEV